MIGNEADPVIGAETRSAAGGRGTARADEVERDFAALGTRLLRPAIVSSLFAVTTARRIGWIAEPPLAAWSGGPVILAANHESHVDTPAILWTLPPALRRRTAVAAASDTFGFEAERRGGPGPLARWALRRLVTAGFRAYPFDRRSAAPASLELSAELIRRGWSLLMFPEGTRGRGEMQRFKPGIGWLARETGAPVVPVHVRGGRRVLPPGAFRPRPGRVVVRYGTPLEHADGADPEAFTAAVERAVRALAGGVPPDPGAVSAAAEAARPLPPSGEAA